MQNPKLYLNKFYMFLFIHNYHVLHKTISQRFFRPHVALVWVPT